MDESETRYRSQDAARAGSQSRYRGESVGDVLTRELGIGIAELKTARLEALAHRRQRWIYAALAIAVISGGLTWAHVTYGWEPWIPIAVGLVIAVAGWFWGALATQAYERQLRTVVMEHVCTSVGDMVYDDAALGFSLSPFAQAKLFNSFDDHTTGQHLHGRYRGCTFSFAHAHLESIRRSGSNNSTTRSTVFRGLLLSVSMPTASRGRIMIFRDWGSFVNTLTETFNPGKRVEIPHEGFEKHYEVYAEHPDEVPSFLTPEFAESFLRLRELVGSLKIVGAFSGSHFFLAIDDVTEFLGGLTISMPLDQLASKADEVREEVLLVHRIIDELHRA